MAEQAQLVALYAEPEDRETFDAKYFGEHLPLTRKMPGLKNIDLVKFTGNAMGPQVPYYMMATLTFDSPEALSQAMRSPEGKAAGTNLMSFAKGVQLLTAELQPEGVCTP
ncbi:MAG: EthD family reductase [Candidatus Melainabacteria bacterium]